MQIFGLRYFSIKAENELFDLPDNFKSKDLFIYALKNESSVTYYNKTYTVRLIKQTVDNRYLVGYFLKSIDTHIINLDGKLFVEKDIENWEKLFFVIDQENQIFASQLSTNIATSDNVKNVLKLLIDKNLSNYGYTVKLDFIADQYKFWSILKTSQGIYQIAFKLNAPNLFGGSKKANEWLTTLKEISNMTTVAVDVRNDRASLKYDPEELESYRDYADSGGGSWTLKVLQNNIPKSYKSSEHLRHKELDLEDDSPGFIINNIGFIIEKMKNIFDILNE
jgi:hypothetical protein